MSGQFTQPLMQEIPNRNPEHTVQFPAEPSSVAQPLVQQSEPRAQESTVQPPAAEPSIEIQMPVTDNVEESDYPQLPTSQPVEPKRTRGRPPKSKGCPWLRKHADVQQSEPQAAEPMVQPLAAETPTMDRLPIVHQQDEPGPALRRSNRERRRPDWHGTRE
jgi:hypothetical protein